MRYRMMPGERVRRVGDEECGVVQSALRKRAHGPALALSFDPGTVRDEVLNARAVDIAMGLLYAQGWRRRDDDVRIGPAAGWADRWWAGTLGPGAFVVETPLWSEGPCEAGALARLADLVPVAWCMELHQRAAARPVPDLMLAVTAEGFAVASIDPALWGAALLDAFDAVMRRMRAQPDPSASPPHAFVALHLEGTSVAPWSVPDRPCVFRTARSDPDHLRVYVALKDTTEPPSHATTCALLHLMLASGATD